MRAIRVAIVVGAAALLVTGALGAQRCATCTPEDRRDHAHLPALGVHAGTPQKASFALGVVVGQDWQKSARPLRNVAIFAEPGLAVAGHRSPTSTTDTEAMGRGLALRAPFSARGKTRGSRRKMQPTPAASSYSGRSSSSDRESAYFTASPAMSDRRSGS